MIEGAHGEYLIREIGLTLPELAPVAELHHEVLPSRAYTTADKKAGFAEEIRAGLDGRDGLVLGAFTPDGRLVAYKLGYRTGNRRECFYSWIGGVHPFHRRRGLYRAMTHLQHRWALQQGFKYVETHTWGDNAAMMILNLQEGFVAIGAISFPDRAGARIILRKPL